MSVQLKPVADLAGLYQQLQHSYGHQYWWPAQGRFEILVGAVLVQNTAWSNVERAVENLRMAGWLEAEAMLGADEAALTEAVRPSGSFRVKTRRLLNLCRWFKHSGGFPALDMLPTPALRDGLLSVHGVGPETADSILLYAFKRPVFVIDAYTRRLLTRLGWLQGACSYEALRAVFELTLPADNRLFAQYHALIVEHAKRLCRKRPQCQACKLNNMCMTAQLEQHE